MTEATRKEVDRIVQSLETVLDNGHILVPVSARDLRILIAAARRAALP